MIFKTFPNKNSLLKKDKLYLFSKQNYVKEIEISEYVYLFKKISFINISHTQSPGYYLKDENPKYIKVYNKKNIIAIATITKKRILKNFIQIVRLNNGPLITSKNSHNQELILSLILTFIRKNFGKLISYSPSFIYKHENIIKSFLTIKLRKEPWATSIIKLDLSEIELLSRLKQKWRNTLKKGLKICEVKEINDFKDFQNIFNEYKAYALNTGFKSISEQKCAEWFRNMYINDNLLSLKVFEASDIEDKTKKLGSIGILQFKEKSLYLFGFTTQLGKKYQANSALLWKAIIYSKNNNFKFFDLGGLNKTTPKGIRKFKESLNGLLEKSPGEYINISLF